MLNRTNAHQPIAAYTTRAVALSQQVAASTPSQPGDQAGPATDITVAGDDGYTTHVMYWDRDVWDDPNCYWDE